MAVELSAKEIERLRMIPILPDTAIVSVRTVAVHDDVSERTVRDTYPLIQISPNRHGVAVGYLRNRHAKPAA
jgi:hypothetical protein